MIIFLKKQSTRVRLNTEKYITFTVSIETEVTRTGKKWRRNYKKYILHIAIS